MWKVDPRWMCRKHLLGEHVEMHMFYGTIKKGISIEGYVVTGLVETWEIKARHDELALEMERRGYNHASPMLEFEVVPEGYIDVAESTRELIHRCQECAEGWRRWE